MAKVFNTKNLLSVWNEDAMAITSPIAVILKYERSKVEFIYTTLKGFFGLSFFEVNVGTDKAINKISWLYGLISTTKSVPCYHALYDICILINYSKTLDLSLQKELQQLKRNPENLRTFFFELFIYRMLDLNQISNIKKLASGNQFLKEPASLMEKLFCLNAERHLCQK